jgi:adenosylcobinamide-GDP ribazoletransferase
LAVALLSRVPMVALMAWMDPARPGGLSRAVGRPELRTAGIATGLAVTLAVVCTGPVAILAGISGALVAFGLGQVAQAKIGGQTGDILGAAQQLADITALAVIVAAL